MIMHFYFKKYNIDNLSNWFSSFLLLFGWGRPFLAPDLSKNNLF